MFKVLVLTLSLFSVVLAETTFERVNKKGQPGVYSFGDDQIFVIPADNGGNWGDKIWGDRVQDDQLISGEIQLNKQLNEEQQFNWTANYPGKSITHIRFLNIGRQRAFVCEVQADGGATATATVQVAPNLEFRLLIEVYVK